MEWSAPRELWIALASFASLVALFQTARITWTRWSRSWAVQARAARALEGELAAEPLLRRAGYEILDRQVRGRWVIYADGAPLEVGLRADLLVAQGGRRYVAEVKTGRLAPRLDHAPTRRQLLEYRIAFGVDGILLVDAEAERVVVVEIGESADPRQDPPDARTSFFFPAVVAAALCGAAVGWLLHA